MFRVFCVFALILCLSAVPLHDWKSVGEENLRRNNRLTSFDDSELVDNTGAGYSYFKKQKIEMNHQVPASNPLSSLDMSEYMKSSALNARPAVVPQQQQQFNRQFTKNQQSDFASVFSPQQRHVFGQIPHQDVQTWSNNQPLLIPQTNFHLQQKALPNSWPNMMHSGNAPVLAQQNLQQTNEMFNPPIPSRRMNNW